MNTTSLDLTRLKVRPLAERDSLTRVEDILLAPDAPPRPVLNPSSTRSASAPAEVLEARRNGAGVIVDLRSAPAAQRHSANSRADDAARLDHAPGHQRGRDDT